MSFATLRNFTKQKQTRKVSNNGFNINEIALSKSNNRVEIENLNQYQVHFEIADYDLYYLFAFYERLSGNNTKDSIFGNWANIISFKEAINAGAIVDIIHRQFFAYFFPIITSQTYFIIFSDFALISEENNLPLHPKTLFSQPVVCFYFLC